MLRAILRMARFTQTSMEYFWKLRWYDFIFHFKEIMDLATEEQGGQNNAADPSTWRHVQVPRVSPRPAPSEEEFVDNARIDIGAFQKAEATQGEQQN